jgi:hypothetical protein
MARHEVVLSALEGSEGDFCTPVALVYAVVTISPIYDKIYTDSWSSFVFGSSEKWT